MSKLLTPPDPERCQVEKSNGVNFMTLGGRRQMVRCEAKPTVIVTENEAGEDGQRGAMSMCDGCLLVFMHQPGASKRPNVSVAPIERQGLPLRAFNPELSLRDLAALAHGAGLKLEVNPDLTISPTPMLDAPALPPLPTTRVGVLAVPETFRTNRTRR